MPRCCSAAFLILAIAASLHADSDPRQSEIQAIAKLEKLCDQPDNYSQQEIEDAASDVESAIRRYSEARNAPRMFVGEMWDVAHRLAPRNPKMSLRFSYGALQYLDQHWATADLNEAERYRIWGTMLQAYATAREWESAIRVASALLQAVDSVAAARDMFSGPGLSDLHLFYARALEGAGRRLEAAEQRRRAQDPIRRGGRDDKQEVLASQVRIPAPGFHLRDLNGGTVQLDDYRGRPVILVFWATWCQPCHAEMEALQRFRSPAAVLAIAADPQPATVAAFLKEHGYTYTVLMTDRSTDRAYEVETLPKTFVLDEGGQIRFMTQGSNPNFLRDLGWMLEAVRPPK